jgi:uncharacterized protein (DUF1015 family)
MNNQTTNQIKPATTTIIPQDLYAKYDYKPIKIVNKKYGIRLTESNNSYLVQLIPVGEGQTALSTMFHDTEDYQKASKNFRLAIDKANEIASEIFCRIYNVKGMNQ